LLQLILSLDLVHLFFPVSSRCDVAKEDDWTILWEHAETFFDDKVSILVNNAGVNPGLGWKTCIDVMLLGVGFGTFQAIEKMGISKVCKNLYPKSL
jgi:NAD(P)-dependent dehydrogenase (short-subunit alcohol dehydrogenase family)